MAKDILKSSLSYTILGFLPLTFALIFTPVYLKYLNETEYGILNLFTFYSSILAQTYSLGISSAFGYIYWDVYKDKSELKSLISDTLGLLLILQLIFIPVGLLFGESILDVVIKSSEVFTFYPYALICLFSSAFMVYYEMFLYFFRNEGEYKKYATLSLSTLALLTVGTLIGVVWLDLKAVGALLGRTFGYGLVIIPFLTYMIYKYGISFNFKKWKLLFVFGLPLFINAIIGSLSYGMDRLLIERFDSLETLGIYGFALVVITVIETLFSALNNALSPTLYKYVNELAKEKSKEIQAISHSIILIIMLTISGILALLYPAMNLIIDVKYHVAAKFVPLLSMAFLWRIFTTFKLYPIYMGKKTNFLLISQLINLALTVILGYLGFQFLGIMGIVYAMYSVKVIEYIIAKKMSQKVKKVEYNFKNLIILTVALGASGFATSNLTYLFPNKYIAYCFPLACLIILAPIVLREELKVLVYIFKNGKKIF